MALVYKVCLVFLFPLPCFGVGWDLTQKFILIAGPLSDDLVSNLNFQSGLLREPLNSATGQSNYLCDGPSLPSLPPYFAELRASGVTHFKVFLPWTRILPEANARNPNRTNVECYRQLLRTLKAADIEPVLILHQKHLPKSLETQLALSKSLTFTNLFVEYAEFSFASFGDLVDTWLTFGSLPEDVERLPHGDLLALPLLASAHEKAYEIYHEKYSAEGKEIGGEEGTWDVPLDNVTCTMRMGCACE